MELESTRGISRLNYETSANGWLVRYTRDGVTFNKLFSDGTYGSPEQSRAAAQEYYDELRTSFPPPTYQEFLGLNKPKSGIHGVRRATVYNKGFLYDVWTARWTLNGKTTLRTFSVNKYGEEIAKELAVKARTDMEPLLEHQYYAKYWNYRTGRRFNKVAAKAINELEGCLKSEEQR
jgi:AP2 domain